jgi:hypothetical protein
MGRKTRFSYNYQLCRGKRDREGLWSIGCRFPARRKVMASGFIRAAVLLLVVARIARADDVLEGAGKPPILASIQDANSGGRVEYHYVRSAPVVEASGRINEVVENRAAKLPLADDEDDQTPEWRIRVFDLAGKRLKKADVTRRLKKGMPVVVSGDSEPVSKFYTQHLNPELMVFVIVETRIEAESEM